MRRFLLIAFLTIATLTTTRTQAQTSDSTLQTTQKQPSPQRRTAHQLTVLQKQLSLTEDQVMQIRVLLLNQAVSLDSLKTNSSADKRSNRLTRRDITVNTDQKIRSLLTDDQKKGYDQWKETQKEQRAGSKKNVPGATTPPPAA